MRAPVANWNSPKRTQPHRCRRPSLPVVFLCGNPGLGSFRTAVSDSRLVGRQPIAGIKLASFGISALRYRYRQAEPQAACASGPAPLSENGIGFVPPTCLSRHRARIHTRLSENGIGFVPRSAVRRPAAYPSPGIPPSVLANFTARRMACATASAAATPRVLMSAALLPSESANVMSPSNIVLTG